MLFNSISDLFCAWASIKNDMKIYKSLISGKEDGKTQTERWNHFYIPIDSQGQTLCSHTVTKIMPMAC